MNGDDRGGIFGDPLGLPSDEEMLEREITEATSNGNGNGALLIPKDRAEEIRRALEETERTTAPSKKVIELKRVEAELRVHAGAWEEEPSVENDHDSLPQRMALYWEAIEPDISPPQGACVFPNMLAAFEAIDQAYPQLIARNPESRGRIAIALAGSTQHVPIDTFREDVALARSLESITISLEEEQATRPDVWDAQSQGNLLTPEERDALDQAVDSSARQGDDEEEWETDPNRPQPDPWAYPPMRPMASVVDEPSSTPQRERVSLHSAVPREVIIAIVAVLIALVGTSLLYLRGGQQEIKASVDGQAVVIEALSRTVDTIDNRTADIVSDYIAREAEIRDLSREASGYEGLALEFAQARSKDAEKTARAQTDIKIKVSRLEDDLRGTKAELQRVLQKLEEKENQETSMPKQ